MNNRSAYAGHNKQPSGFRSPESYNALIILCDAPEEDRKIFIDLLHVCENNLSRQQQRNSVIRLISKYFTNPSRTLQCEALATAYKRYLASGWKNEKYETLLASETPTLNVLLHRLARLNRGKEIGARQIFNILAS